MTRLAVIGLALVALVAGVAGALLGSPWRDEAATTAAPQTASARPTTDDALSIVATATGPLVTVHESPDGAVRQPLPNPLPSNAPLTFLVREQRVGWLRVLLPLRPNGSEGWIKLADVTLNSHRFRIVVELGAHRITVTKGDEVILQEPVGVGTADTPTPGGLYYTKELLQPPNPNGPYGPFAYGLSGFSNVLTSFAGGEGVVGIHGTDDPSALGKDVSKGCIRMSNEGITRLAEILPLGVPVEITP
ncbi:MAG TPA: L,D-transpeptidase [Acidimicrobiales bacterium]|nr:L,D-transpeptidase [Acidimicrobiales bacterium]